MINSKSSNQRGIAHILLLLLLGLGIVLGVYLVGQRTNIFPWAASNPVPTICPLSWSCPNPAPSEDINPQTASFVLNGPLNVDANSNFVVTLRVKSPTEAINTVFASLTFDQSKLEINGIKMDPPEGSFITQVDDNYFNNQTGEISLLGGLPDPGLKTTTNNGAVMAIISFKTKGSGPASISMNSSSRIISNDGAKNIASVTMPFVAVMISPAGSMCGGIAGIQCPSGYRCQYSSDRPMPDQGGICVSGTPRPTPTPTPTPFPPVSPTPTPRVSATPTPTPVVCPSGSSPRVVNGQIVCVSQTQSQSPSATPTPQACAISTVNWVSPINPTSAGNFVALRVTGTGNCLGQQVSFVVQEDDGFIGADPVVNNPVNATLGSNNIAISSWIAEFQQDGFNGFNNPPEYKFIASLVSNPSSSMTTGPEQNLRVNNLRQGDIINGDGNGDGRVDILDLAVLRKWWGKTGFPQAVDVNDDGVLNVPDLSGLRKILETNGIIKSPVN